MRGRETLWLVGMMGAGKSAVGAALARRLGRPLVDTDAEVEARAGASVAEIFAREGERAFRKRERDAVDRAAGTRAVVSLGGGAAAEPGAMERLRAAGPVVYLRARPATLLARLGDAAARPLLAGLDAVGREARLAGLLAERRGAYEQADVVVDTDGLDVAAVCERVAAQLAEAGLLADAAAGEGVG